MSQPVTLPQEVVREIEKSLSHGKGVEIAIRNGKIVVWETSSKKLIEAAVA